MAHLRKDGWIIGLFFYVFICMTPEIQNHNKASQKPVETTAELIKRVSDDGFLSPEEMESIKQRYESTRDAIETDTRNQLEELIVDMLKKNGVAITKENQHILEEQAINIPEEIQNKLNNNEKVTVVMQNGKLIEKPAAAVAPAAATEKTSPIKTAAEAMRRSQDFRDANKNEIVEAIGKIPDQTLKNTIANLLGQPNITNILTLQTLL